MENAPAPASGRGLECDKLSREGIEACFRGLMAKIIEDVGPAAGKTSSPAPFAATAWKTAQELIGCITEELVGEDIGGHHDRYIYRRDT
jgi:hypothetical protein